MKKKEKIEYLRLNEAGDFRNQEEVRKWNYIASRLYNKYGIRTYGYTARQDLDFSRAPFITVNASVPDVKGAARQYVCIPKDEYDNKIPGPHEYKCPADCTKCHMCKNMKFKGTIWVRPH